jgi:serine/threonine protein kinase
MYIAEMGADKQLVLIKFARWHSIELHRFCAKSGHAPQILAFERLPGGWFAVAMEYIEFGVPITDLSLLPAHRDRWMAKLLDLMDSFHEKDFVHSDLRDVNIICKNDSVMLIDFGWGGKEGEASYPTWNLNDELLEGRVSSNLTIRKEDDRRVLKNTLAKLMGIHR